jgi:hypothetical protein
MRIVAAPGPRPGRPRDAPRAIDRDNRKIDGRRPAGSSGDEPGRSDRADCAPPGPRRCTTTLSRRRREPTSAPAGRDVTQALRPRRPSVPCLVLGEASASSRAFPQRPDRVIVASVDDSEARWDAGFSPNGGVIHRWGTGGVSPAIGPPEAGARVRSLQGQIEVDGLDSGPEARDFARPKGIAPKRRPLAGWIDRMKAVATAQRQT